MWRNFGINDTYEPGSTFKIVTSSAGLEEGVITPDSTFYCKGGLEVGKRYIKCWRSPRAHGAQNFVQGMQNSCNPVFMETAARLGAETFYEYMHKFGFSSKTGVDLPGEAVGIMHKLENVGPVELATMSFGQSFQITPLQLLRAVSASINGGYLVTPHVGTKIIDGEGMVIEEFNYEKGESVISEETSETMREILESVVEAGTGNRTYIPGYRVGGKTATSEKLPRRMGKYISSFLTFSPAEKPQVLALVLIDEPVGAYYGGQVVGPVMKELLENILPYLGVNPVYSEKELEMTGVGTVSVPELTGLDVKIVKETLRTLNLEAETVGSGSVVAEQFPPAGEEVNQGTKVILYTDIQ
jgi:stage V sporulation protein D (sporulation-specific penicillin-binding protein)